MVSEGGSQKVAKTDELTHIVCVAMIPEVCASCMFPKKV